MAMVDDVWRPAQQRTITELLEARVSADPDSEYLDVCGTKLSAFEVHRQASSLAGSLRQLGVRPGDRVATLLENSPEMLLAWYATILAGAVSVPVNTAYKGDYLRHQLDDCGAGVVIVAADLEQRIDAICAGLPALEHVITLGAGTAFARAATHGWAAVLAAAPVEAEPVRPAALATFVYTGGTTGLSKGCMLTHNYHAELAEQIGFCWERTAEDVAWTALPMFHFNALVTAIVGPLIFGGRAAICRRFSVSNFWPEMNRTGATIISALGTMGYLLAHDVDRPEMPRSGAREANASLRLMGVAPLPPEVDDVIKSRFGVATFSGAYGVTEASLVSWQPPGVRNRPHAAGILNSEYFDVRIFDDDDNELPRGAQGEIVLRPKRPHAMFEGYWGRPEVTVETSRNWWYHTGDVGSIDADDYLYFVDRKADYLRRRGENIASFEVERIVMGHGSIADVAVHAVPSQFTEDDLKLTVTRKQDADLSEADLFRWCIHRLPYFALPRYIEFRAELPRSPVGRVLKRELRAEGVTAATWDADASGITYEKK